MATRKKTTRPPRPPSARELWVLIENNQSHFKVFGEGLAAVRDGLAATRDEVAATRADVARLDRTTTEGFGRVDRDLTLVKSAVVEHGRELRELRGEVGEVRSAVKRVEDALEKKVDRDEVEAIAGRIAGRAT